MYILYQLSRHTEYKETPRICKSEVFPQYSVSSDLTFMRVKIILSNSNLENNYSIAIGANLESVANP